MPGNPSSSSAHRVEATHSRHGDAANSGSNQPIEMQAKIRRAKEILAGRFQPDLLVMSPRVDDFLKRQFDAVEPPVTKGAKQEVADWLNLQAHYGGHPVACFKTGEGALAVLAVGEEEIEALVKSLSSEEAAKVLVEYPDPPIEFDWPGATASPKSS